MTTTISLTFESESKKNVAKHSLHSALIHFKERGDTLDLTLIGSDTATVTGSMVTIRIGEELLSVHNVLSVVLRNSVV